MPITIDPACTDKLRIEEFIAHVEQHVDLSCAEGLAESAPHFRKLANDVDLIPSYFNRAIKKFLDHSSLAAYTPQSVFLVAGRGFFLRANIWTPLKLSENFRSQEERVFSYRNTHDHNFHFMTVGYHGPGYETNLYQYDPSRVRGYIGEVVELESLGRTMLQVGRVMVYREKVDVHTQFPPEQLSVSLNLMVTKKRECEPDQYFFDPSDGRIIEMPQIALVHKRASIVALAGQLANSDTADVIESLIIDAPCRRVREAALVAASTLRELSAGERLRLIELGADDRDEVVRFRARSMVAERTV
ncbi:HEAT repeat domain-containing protein [Xanthomonas oryzae]|uniref:HEAT repeat domain-containing protein n=1 Tax=Xanthomonas oryzae TaxID=347 RepID=UPI000B14B281|nr:HEAT repeat domain-containing protein [Xanthomonas oryzae]UXV88786.1 hypothetical protein IXO597_000680 [Xanthomonas oryzae pv. oryzae]